MKTAIVTGASRGIGRAIANELLNRGYYVISIARNFDNDTKTMQNQKCISLDLMKNSAIDELKAQIKDYDINTIIHNLGGKINEDNQPLTSQALKNSIHFNLGIAVDINSLLIPKIQNSSIGGG